MPELINAFSWSFSAAEDFDQCRRKRYWAKYAMWGGWKTDAAPQQRAAYRLGKMENGFSILGQAVEAGALWLIRENQDGRAGTAEAAYDAAARPLLNRAWKESREGLWRENPKKFFCLREHYYKELGADTQREWVDAIVVQARKCLANFIATVLPRIADVTRAQEVPVATIGAGDPESFEIEGVKIYAIPDYVYRRGEELHIHDWKAGKSRERHQDQLSLYGLWAALKHQVPVDRINVHVEYLAEGRDETRRMTDADIEAVKERIGESVMEMAEYLKSGDLRRNEPLPKDVWDLAPTRAPCALCNFYELCKPELDALG